MDHNSKVLYCFSNSCQHFIHLNIETSEEES
jgi:hypothetical protein